MKYFLIFILTSSFLLGLTVVEPLKETSKKNDNHKLTFYNKKEVLGKLKFENQTDQVRVEFEGSDLSAGKYKVVKVENCSSFKKKNREKEVLNELLSFETKYGNISTEKMLANTKLEELNINDTNVALVKLSKGKIASVYCSN